MNSCMKDHDSDHGLEAVYLEKAGKNNNHTVNISPAHSANHAVFTEGGEDKQPNQQGLGVYDTPAVSGPLHALDLPDDEPDDVLLEIDKQSLSDTVEILRSLQRQLIKGRAMDVFDDTSSPEGGTNYNYYS